MTSMEEYSNQLKNHNADFPITTLFLVESIDGKITTGLGYGRDFDSDIIVHDDLRQGMMDYYEIERNTDYWSCISGKIAAKLGANDEQFFKEKKNCCFVVIDNSHLTFRGRLHIANNCDQVVFVTKNDLDDRFLPSNAKILKYNDFEPNYILRMLKGSFGVERLTIQTGGELNAQWAVNDAIDYIKIVIAPIIVGGCYTTTLVDGKNSLMDSEYGLKMFSKFRLLGVSQLSDSFVCMDYVRIREAVSPSNTADDLIYGLIKSAGTY